MKIIGIEIFAIGVISLIGGTVIRLRIPSFDIPNLTFVPSENKIITFVPEAPFCKTSRDFGGVKWKIYDLAALLVMANFLSDGIKDFFIDDSRNLIPTGTSVVQSKSPSTIIARYILESLQRSLNRSFVTDYLLSSTFKKFRSMKMASNYKSKLLTGDNEQSCINFNE